MLWFNFILGLNFIFFCLKLIIIHYHTQKQKKIKFKPRIKLNHNTYIRTRHSSFFTTFPFCFCIICHLSFRWQEISITACNLTSFYTCYLWPPIEFNNGGRPFCRYNYLKPLNTWKKANVLTPYINFVFGSKFVVNSVFLPGIFCCLENNHFTNSDRSFRYIFTAWSRCK